MPIKAGLNRKEIVQCALWLEEGIKPKDIAKKFSTTVDVVKRFTRAKIDAADKRARNRRVKMAELKKKNEATAEVLGATLAKTLETDDGSDEKGE